MKRAIAVLMLLAGVARGQTMEPVSIAFAYQPITNVIIGPMTISTTSGKVTIQEGVTLDEASRLFWEVLFDAYQDIFPATITQTCERVHCDTPADLCAKNGHQWRGGCGMLGCATIHPIAMRHCAVCGQFESQPSTPSPMPWLFSTGGVITLPYIVTNADWLMQLNQYNGQLVTNPINVEAQ